MDAARAMLEQLMGPGRDEKEKDKTKAKEKFKHASVCKSFLVGFCPLDAAYLGGKRQFRTCEQLHSELMKDQFEAHPEKEKLKRDYEVKGIYDFERAVRDCEGRITTEKSRILEEWGKVKPIDRLAPEIKSKVAEMKAQSLASMHLAEKLVNNFNETRRLMKEADELTKKATALEEAECEKVKNAPPEEQVCEVCAACYMGSPEADEAHKKMNIHNVYQAIRDRLEQLREIEKELEAEKEKKDKERNEKEQAEREKEKEDGRARDRSRSGKDKSRSRKEGSRSRRDKSGSRRDKSGSRRDKSRSRRDGSKSRRDRSKSRRKGKEKQGRGRDSRDRRDRDKSRGRGRGDKDRRETRNRSRRR
eukprot:TRINITY_DN1945_c0_g1_i1.p1 TRINITY_DN1945_c0_g1~~TRINITY_DN1945_c0_g1_i1.p1  ORF type:complete len:378 (+),score=91.39 TRINITY_DN1945_c0_g1_i1:54-1136(+)